MLSRNVKKLGTIEHVDGQFISHHFSASNGIDETSSGSEKKAVQNHWHGWNRSASKVEIVNRKTGETEIVTLIDCDPVDFLGPGETEVSITSKCQL